MLNPAKTVIDICGGPAAVSSMLNVKVSNVYRWTYPKERSGGCGGIIPAVQQAKLLTAARSAGIDLRPEHFFMAESAGQ